VVNSLCVVLHSVPQENEFLLLVCAHYHQIATLVLIVLLGKRKLQVCSISSLCSNVL